MHVPDNWDMLINYFDLLVRKVSQVFVIVYKLK